MTPEETLVHQTVTYRYVGALVDELAHAGVRHACVCPGSRSTPLAYTLAGHPAIKTWVHIDERSGAFFALGLAKALREPVALVCTSGTAAANVLPAVVEARYGRVPLIVLTADRPPELRDNGAPQAIDQVHLYGRNAKWFVDMALPEGSDAALRYARATAARAAATALEGPSGPGGPVHLNMPFREPLTPPDGRVSAALYARKDSRPYTTVAEAPRVPSPEFIARLTHDLLVHPYGLIVCGPHTSPELAPVVTTLAAALDYPILADPLSGVRRGPHDLSRVLDSYDALLRDERAVAELPLDLALRFGAIPTSKPLQTFIQKANRQIIVDAEGGWPDPAARADTVVHADAASLCAGIVERVKARGHDHRGDAEGWVAHWRAADGRARAAMASYMAKLDEPLEGKVFSELADLLPDGATLYAGNSMPVRDLDTFYPKGERRVRFLCNRGANGIDGVVSSALGAAASRHNSLDNDGPLVLVIGDLSFYHDLNGLLAAKRYPIDATIVLLNNDGGGIFSFLPQAANPDHFEQLFGTPTGLDFKPIVEAYGCGFERVENWADFRRAMEASLSTPGAQVVELRTDRDRNVALHRAVWQRVAEAAWRA